MVHSLIKLAGLCLLALVIPNGGVEASAAPEQTYSISGRVTDGLSNGIDGATVTLSGTQSGTTMSDSNGNYSFANLAAGGNYNLSPSKPGGYTGFAVMVNNLSSDVIQNLRLDQFITFNVTVKDMAGNGLAGVSIGIETDILTASAMTGSNGTLTISMRRSSSIGSNPMFKLIPQKPGYIFDPSSLTFHFADGDQNVIFTGSLSGAPVTYLQFSSLGYVVSEGDGSATITVTRTGDTSTAAGVSYFTGDGTGTQKSDYVMSTGSLDFAPGETTKSFTVLIIDNAYVKGPPKSVTVILRLAAPTGGAFLGDSGFASLIILDNDQVTATTSPLDTAQFFVRQHYYDFLNRLPDQPGLDYWAGHIAHCGSDSNCLRNERVGVSAAFFIEEEFQRTAFLVYRFYAGSVGLLPDYAHFMVDRNRLIGSAQLPQSTLAFANDFVQRGVFTQLYPASLTPTEFVNKLFNTAQLMPYDAERQQAIQALTAGSKTRAQVLLDVIEIPELKNRLYNPAFVLMQYYSYLRRDPDADGYQFWLNVLNNKLPNDDSGYRAMVCAFITSLEYQDRFSPVHSHSNADCGP
jgi:hypothetical protein